MDGVKRSADSCESLQNNVSSLERLQTKPSLGLQSASSFKAKNIDCWTAASPAKGFKIRYYFKKWRVQVSSRGLNPYLGININIFCLLFDLDFILKNVLLWCFKNNVVQNSIHFKLVFSINRNSCMKKNVL